MSREGKLEPLHYPETKQSVGTDPEYARLVRGFKELYETADALFADASDEFFAFEDRRTGVYPQEDDAYIAPPLVGVWASAPYFHNGSVPTLEQVLSAPGERAALWERNPDPYAYDHQQVGLAHGRVGAEEHIRLEGDVDHESPSSSETLRYRRIYDTRAFGRSNAGHAFGLNLTAAQRRDLLEYLKRL
jgi:hypothetical protein